MIMLLPNPWSEQSTEESFPAFVRGDTLICDTVEHTGGAQMDPRPSGTRGNVRTWSIGDSSLTPACDLGSTFKPLASPHVLFIDQSLGILTMYGTLLHDEQLNVTMSSTLLSVE
jgi:hypothetical protein